MAELHVGLESRSISLFERNKKLCDAGFRYETGKRQIYLMAPQESKEGNTLYYGDNLDILRRYIADKSVDLVYLDPPVKSEQDYNVLFAAKDGTAAAAQIQAFEDTWHWDEHAARDGRADSTDAH